jgi:VanZ family protein/O-antigen ligase
MTPRILLTIVALAYLLFVLYGSFVPIRISPLSFSDAILAFRSAPWLDMRTGHRSDWVANVLLFVPLACLWLGVVWPRRPTSRALASIAIFAACVALAVSIEFTQVFFPSRTVSLNDMVAETIGAGMGVAAWWMFGAALTAQIVTGALMLRTTSWLERALGIYLCGLVLWALLPLDLTLSPVEMYTKYKTGNLILTPFLFHQATWGATASGFLPEIARWIPVGLLCRQLRSRATFATQLGTAVGIVAVVEMLQLFVSTRVADVNDVLAAGLGAAIGNRLGAAFSGSHAAETPSELTPVWRAPAVVAGRAPVEGPALVEGRALVSPFLGVVAYLVLLTVTAFWQWAKVNLRDGGWLEWLSVGSGIATVAWCARRGVISWRPRHRVSWLALALGGWVLLCAVVAALVGQWGDSVEYRVRQFGIGLTLYLVTTNTFGHRGHLLLPAAGLTAVLLSFGLTNPAALALNQNVGAFAGIVLPMVGAAVSVTRSLLVQLPFGLAAVTLVWLVAETRNRGAAVALVAMVVVLAAQSRRRVAALAMVALLVAAGGVLFVTTAYGQRFVDVVRRGRDYASVQERLDLWSLGWHHALDHPLFGLGPGNFGRIVGRDAHNNVVAMLAETGFLGAALYSAFFIAAIATLWRIGQSGDDRHAAVARWLAAGIVAWFGVALFLGLETNAIAFVYAGTAVALSARRTQPRAFSIRHQDKGDPVGDRGLGRWTRESQFLRR